MTGTLIALGSELAAPTPGWRTKVAMIATFVPAVAVATLALRAQHRRIGDEAVVRRFVLAEAVILAGMMLLGGLLSPLPPGSWPMIVVAMAAVLAMSVQSVLTVHLLAFHPATTVMTLNIVHFIGHALGAARLPAALPGGPPRTSASEARRYAWAIVPYLAGVASGGFGYRWLGFWSIGVTVAALVVLWTRLGRRSA